MNVLMIGGFAGFGVLTGRDRAEGRRTSATARSTPLLKDVQPLTGYIRGGVDDGQEEGLSVYLDETASCSTRSASRRGRGGSRSSWAPRALLTDSLDRPGGPQRRHQVWVEAIGDSDVLRARNLYTGRITERTVDEIEEVATQVYLIRGTLALKLTEAGGWPDSRLHVSIPRRPPGYPDLPPRDDERPRAGRGGHRPDGPPCWSRADSLDFEGKPMVKRVTWADRLGDFWA